MIEYSYSTLGQKVYFKEYENGLQVYLLPNENYNKYYVNVVTKYGSNDVEFIPQGESEYVKTPVGIAHFLEHKVFELEDNDPFEYFASTGTGANAGTNYFSTRYYIWGTKNIYDNVRYLLNMVYTPYFEEESVEREKKIITEEIKMYDDDPSWALEDSVRSNMFVDSYMREKISGTVQSIQEITPDNLRLCYNTFYHPSNMVIVISGNFDYQKMFTLISENEILKKIKNKIEIKRRKSNEEDYVLAEFEKLNGNIIRPKFKYGFKINKDYFTLKDSLKVNMYLNCMFSTILGEASLFYEKAHKENLTTGYYYEHSYFNNYYILEIEAESDKADMLKEALDEVLAKRDVSEIDLERHKKLWMASEIRLGDHLDILADGIMEDIITYGKPYFDRTDIIKELSYDEMKLIMQELDLSNNTFSLLMPIKK